MLTQFEDKVAVITGAGSGIGAALARGFSTQGMRIIVADIDKASAAATAASIGDSAHAFAVDVATEQSVDELADFAFENLGQVDLLINNAGVFQGGLTWERSVADWEWALGVNLYGIIHAIRAFVPRMMAQNSEGHIINTASVAAFVAGPASAPYVVSKCAAFSISECLALDLQVMGSKIGASVLTPSNFNTGIAQTARVRPAAMGSDTTADGQATVEALQDMLSSGQDPEAVFKPVLEGIRNGEFLIPTRPSYAAQLGSRYDALLKRALPPLADVD